MAKAEIVFATITGNNEDIADIIAENLEEQGLDVQVDEISQADVSDFEDADLCIVCPYTYDEGNLPDEGMDFFDDLQETDLSGKIYGVAGSGDTFYGEYYCTAVDEFSRVLKEAGAIQGAPDVKINLSPDTDEDLDTLDQFTDQLVAKLEE
ncbi:flavodoxin [Ligilactobacillus aviarius]|uniref:flavodoxin n=1 Tax=Ligilactobacillus aviarius TaxID=1606 RepID=UPI0007D936F0|nr:flavodoxin [Ligilactobacillus aviarius]OAQ01545.1 flavodoxin [Ligilactobacillus aviarius]OAQ02775.1 flavodoxin [Ligilactobacillus aviarius]OAQ07737.1 flavodoxin [Ligilactobacillus aviarius]OAS75486.1 flavodoxin [Ligilactobacillus aviarius]OAS78443.1 flavodoxin [Ligilactobacillus aviarius]